VVLVLDQWRQVAEADHLQSAAMELQARHLALVVQAGFQAFLAPQRHMVVAAVVVRTQQAFLVTLPLGQEAQAVVVLALPLKRQQQRQERQTLAVAAVVVGMVRLAEAALSSSVGTHRRQSPRSLLVLPPLAQRLAPIAC
jgi:hypothetical protein